MPFDGSNYDPATKLLLQAKTLLEERGWCQGVWRTVGGARCAIMAIRDATNANNITPHAHTAAQRLAKAMGFDNVQGIPTWNDTHSEEEVLAAFDRAIGG